MTEERLQDVLGIVPMLIKISSKKLWIDYDEEADILYISFERPQNATDSEMLENGILVRYKDDEIVGLTVQDASQR